MRRPTTTTTTPARRPLRRAGVGLLSLLLSVGSALAVPYTPSSDDLVLANVPMGARHSSVPERALTTSRLDVALPLAQFYVGQARTTGDLRFLGYAEAVLAPWMARRPVAGAVLVLHATVLQSRHAFGLALADLDQALALQPDDAQAWLTRATVLRVLGRYPEALDSCAHLAAAADPSITALCTQAILGLSGHLRTAYAAIAGLPSQTLPPEAQAWRYSELGEMAGRLGNDVAAEHWLRAGLQVAPGDLYLRSACADVLLRHGRAAETLSLLAGYESMEPMLLRMVIADQLLKDPQGARARAQLSGEFDIEVQRGEAVHRREQARYLLDVESAPEAALAAALQNWTVQREPEDVLVLLRAATAAHRPEAAAPAVAFLRNSGMEDARLQPYLQGAG